MDLRAVNTRKPMKRVGKGVKVVYISSPMKVKATASEFRALVQELTGRHSDAERAFSAAGDTFSDGSDHLKRRVDEGIGRRDENSDGFEFGSGFPDFSMEYFGNGFDHFQLGHVTDIVS